MIGKSLRKLIGMMREKVAYLLKRYPLPLTLLTSFPIMDPLLLKGSPYKMRSLRWIMPN
jgi:hypothetical protein